MRTVCIVQSRMGNSRLPGKNGMMICGAPQIWHVLARIKRMHCFNDIMLAIPHESNGGIQIEAARDLGIETLNYRGDPQDVVHRFCLGSDIMDASIVVRIPGDNTFIDRDEVERIVSYHSFDPGRWDYLTTNLDRDVLGNGYAAGFGAEVYDVRLIQWLDRTLVSRSLREHPHKWCFENAKVRTLKCPSDIKAPSLSLSVDTAEDFALTKEIYEALYPTNPDFNARDVINYLGVKECLI